MAAELQSELSPVPLTRRELYKHNTFEFWSPKMGRTLLLLGPSQFDVALILEFDHDVESYCERPPLQVKILPLSSGRSRALDFWVQRRNGRQSGLIVFEASPKFTEDLLRRSLAEAKMQWDVWLRADLVQRRLLIRNLKHLRPYVSCDEPAPEEIQRQVTDFLEQYGEGRWDQVAGAVFGASASHFASAVARMYHAGQLDLDLETTPLSCRTWIKAR